MRLNDAQLAVLSFSLNAFTASVVTWRIMTDFFFVMFGLWEPPASLWAVPLVAGLVVGLEAV